VSERPCKRAKILYLIPALVQGGAERQILELMRRIDPDRFEARLCVFSAEGVHYHALLPPGEPRYVLGVSRVEPAGLWRFARILREEKPDIVHSFMDRANFYARVGALLAGPKRPAVVTSVRGPLMQLRFLAVERLLSALGERIVTNSVGIQRELVGWARVPPERVQVIPNIVNLERFAPPSEGERAEARARWGVARGATVAAFVGMIGIAKFHLGYVHALWRLGRARCLPQGFVTLCAGRKRDSLPHWLLPHWVRLLKVGPLLRFLGPVQDIRALYAAADFAVLPSLYEGLSNAVLEALASGLPLVVSQGANRDGFVEDGVSGFVFATGNTRSLAAALGRMLALSPEERRRMGARGREHLLARLPPERPLSEVTRLYEEILAKRSE
jgi:glycosyltransferase involved in cell wall biosynthesis